METLEFVWRVYSSDDTINQIFSNLDLAMIVFKEALSSEPTRIMCMSRVKAKYIHENLWKTLDKS